MKTNSQFIEEFIRQLYRPRNSKGPQSDQEYAALKQGHAKVLACIGAHLKNVEHFLPPLGAKVWAVQDLRPIGKGVFVGDYFYNEHGFVANIDDDDAYGFVTHWVAWSELDCAILDLEKMQCIKQD